MSKNKNKTDTSAHDVALEYAKAKLEEEYRREESIKKAASMQIAIFSFLITGIIMMDIGLFENEYYYFKLSLVLSSLIVLTMLIAIFFAILSQWRMPRSYLPSAKEVIHMIDSESKKEKAGKEQLLWSIAEAADSMDKNNDKRTKIVIVAHYFAVASLIEIPFSVVVVVLLTI